MTPNTSPHIEPPADSRILAEFLHELNIARRSLTLYPADHPQVSATSKKTLNRLERLFFNRSTITLGIAPDALFFDHQWLDKNDAAFRSFAVFLSALGIASISFMQGLSAEQLIRFCQLLRSDRTTIEGFGGFKLLLEQQQIDKISVVPVDYSAFQASDKKPQPHQKLSPNLWEDFLHGLLDNILELREEGFQLAPETIAELLNEKIAGAPNNSLPKLAIDQFVTRFLNSEAPDSKKSSAGQLGKLINSLAPDLQPDFLRGTFNELATNPAASDLFLQQISPELLQRNLDPRIQQQLQSSPRLVELVGQLTANVQSDSHGSKTESRQLDKEMVRARLEVLFSEESHDSYLPDSYQSALDNMLSDATENSFSLPEDVREELLRDFESQSVEEQCCAVIFEILDDPAALEDEENLQQNLLDLSRFFLDTGNFKMLQSIYCNWSNYLHSGKSHIDLFAEKVLANHTQQAFMLEVLDGVELWGEEQRTPIRKYIAAVGHNYTEAVIEQLALAEHFKQRQYWMQVLETIGTDANQLLLQSLDDERWYLIRNLLIVLGKNLQPATLKAVQRLSSHPHPRVRQEVIRVLQHCNPATANRLLLEELESDDPEAQLAAIEVAANSNDSIVLNRLHQLLQTELGDGSDLERKQKILASLAKINNRDSLSLLRYLLQKKGLLTSKRQKQFQQAIIYSLPDYKQPEAKKLLREIAAGRQRQLSALANKQLHKMPGGQG